MPDNICQYWKTSECSLQTSYDNTNEGLRIGDNIGQNMTNIGRNSTILDNNWQY